MDAHLDTFSTEVYHLNIRVGRITRWQASMGGFAPKATPSPPSPVASESKDDDDDDDGDDDDASNDANSTDEMSTWHSTLCYSWQKWGVVLDMRVVILRRRVSF